MIPKLIQTGSYDFGSMNTQLVHVHSRGVDSQWMQKHASASELFHKELANLKANPNETILHIIALGDEERYGCLVAGTPIVMANGSFKNIEDISVGEHVLSGMGCIGTVTSTFVRDVASTISVRVEGIHDPVQMSEGHPLLRVKPGTFDCIRDKYKQCKPGLSGCANMCLRGNGCAISDRSWDDIELEFCKAHELTNEDYLVFHLPEAASPRHISKEEARLIGYWLAEGSIIWRARHLKQSDGSRIPAGVQFCFGKHELSTFVADTVGCFNELGYDTHVYINDIDNTANVHVACADLASDWLSWFGHGCANKHIPNWMCNLPEEIISNILYAYMCGDGSVTISPKESRAYAAAVSKSLVYGVQRLFWSIGVSAVVCESKTAVTRDPHIISKNKPPIKSARQMYHVSYALEKAPELLKFGAAPRQGSKIRNFVVGRTVYLAVRDVQTTGPAKVYNLEVTDDHTYTSYNFCSHNCNRNGDAFNRADNIAKHASFVDIGHVFRNHKNTDPALAVGRTIASGHNDVMDRVELLVGLDNSKCAAEAEAANNGEDVAFSMGSLQDFDICSVCHHKAPTAKQHCSHIKNHLNEVLEDGSKIYMKNPNPKYFDISVVHKPADRIAYMLKKVALAVNEPSGYELADAYGLAAYSSPKYATMRALASMYKEIPLSVKEVVKPNSVRANTKLELKQKCAAYGIQQVLAKLASLGVCLAPQDFAEIIVGHPAPDQFAKISISLEDLATKNIECDSFNAPVYYEHILLSDSTLQDLKTACSILPESLVSRSIAVISQKTAHAMVQPSIEQDAMSTLYGQYKLAIAEHFQDRPRVQRMIAATF